VTHAKGLVRALVVALLVSSAAAARAQDRASLPADLSRKVDKVVADALKKTGVPSASVALVLDGRIAYVKAYGAARVAPRVPAAPGMRYAIGSISKQFTAAAILLLQEEGKLSLDDKVSRFVPDLTRADEVTIRQLLSHTSGYQDYWPQDYVMPMMLEPITADRILDLWARKPLDFDPGTKWQYSNTNYVVAGLVVEKAGGMPFLEFLRTRVLAPLGMKSVADVDTERLGDTDATGYLRYALGPPRPAPKEGKGWLFAMGELAMTAEDLARWDVSIIERKLLSPASYHQLETEVVLANGLSTGYGLGVSVYSDGGHRALAHGGEVSGFTAQNVVYPDDRVAVAVLTNQDAADAAGEIAGGIAPLLLATTDRDRQSRLDRARKIFEGLQRGRIDRSLFTDDANAYFGEQALKDFAASLGPLGAPKEFEETHRALRGGMTLRAYSVKLAKRSLRVWTFETPDGKLEQYQIAPED
jgi:CubicO group peptidase (beta-lactamase class C family)